MDNAISKFRTSTEEKLLVKKSYMRKDKYGNLEYIVYELEKVLNDGSKVSFYKASSFFRLTRVSKESTQNASFMKIHTDIVTTMYNTNINFIEIIANVLKPEPIGLVFLYGVQSTGNSEEEAIRKCSCDFEALLSAFQATHRLDHITGVTDEIMQFVFRNLSKQKFVSVVKGIPASRISSGDNRGMLKQDTQTEEQLEQFLAGSDQIEFCLVLMATPIDRGYLTHWLTKTLEEQTKWERQKQGSTSLGLSVGIPLSMSMNQSTGTSKNSGTSRGTGTNSSKSHNSSLGETTTDSKSHSETSGGSKSTSSNWNTGESHNHTDGTSDTKTNGSSDTFGMSVNIGGEKVPVHVGVNASNTVSSSRSLGTSSSDSSGTTDSYGGGTSEGTSWSNSDSMSTSKGTSKTNSDGWSTGDSTNKGSSFSNGTSTSRSSGLSTGMNLGFNLSKSYQWVDKTVEYICQLLEQQNNRLKQMKNGDGGFFVDMYIATDTIQHQRALEGVAQVTWVNRNSMIDMLRLETPSISEQKQLGIHLSALSPCMDIVVNPKNPAGYYYKYSSVLSSSELAGYCHPPRITIGGLDNAMEDLPNYFNVPTNRGKKEIAIGKVLAPSRFSYQKSLECGNGYATDFSFGIGNDEMHHAFISGASRSGKSVLATTAVLNMYNNVPYIDRYGNKKRKRVLVLDPKGEWRKVANLLPKGTFKFYSVGKPNFHPLKMNLLRVPTNVSAYNYFNLITSHFCSAYGLLDRAVAEISGAIYELYDKNDVFGHEDDPAWANEHSKNITFDDVYTSLEKKLVEARNNRDQHGAEALQTYLTRLDMYSPNRAYSNEHIMFCNRGGDSADTLLGKDDFTVIESNGLSEKSMRFFFILLMNSIYEYALNSGPEGFYTNSYETVIVLEEANSVLISNENDEAGQSSIQRFNEIIDKSASLGLFIWTITQKIASMPKSVIANSGIMFIGRTAQGEDVKVVCSALGFDERRGYEMIMLLPRLSTGMFIAKVSKGRDIASQTPVLIQANYTKSSVLGDKELEIAIKDHEMSHLFEEQ